MLTNYLPNPVNHGQHTQVPLNAQSSPSNFCEKLSSEQRERVIRAEKILTQNHPAVVVYDRIGEIAKALLDQNEPSVTLPGKIADRIYQFVGSFFKRNLHAATQEPESSPEAQSPAEAPLPSDVPPVQNPPSKELKDGFYCSSRIFEYDIAAGTTSLQLYVPSYLDCECAGTNALYQAGLKLIYFSDYQATSIREYRFTAYNITAIFTADRFLPRQLTDIIPDKMPEILSDISKTCSIDQYKTTRIIIGCVVGGAGLLFFTGLGLYYNRSHLKKCDGSRC